MVSGGMRWAGLGLAVTAALVALAPAAELPTDQRPQSPRAMLELFDMGPQFFQGFADDRPVDAAEQDRLASLLYRLSRIPAGSIEAFQHSQELLPRILAEPAPYRGEVVRIAGRARRVERVPLAPELRQRLGREQIFRCTLLADDGPMVVVDTWEVPAAWPIDEPLDRRCAIQGLFIKSLPGDGAAEGQVAGDRALLFAAARVQWFPPGLLGDLGMDAGLFDTVQDRGRLAERECFYQLLAAVRRAPAGAIERESGQKIAALAGTLRELLADKNLDAKSRAGTARMLDRAERGVSDIVPLFNQPQAQRGKLFTLAGEALRAVEIRVNDADIIRRFGIDHYYEVEIVTPDSQNNPIVCCVAELPAEMPRGDYISEPVRVSGFFLKTWAFTPEGAKPGNEQGAKRQQLAPLLVAQTLAWQPAPAIASSSTGAVAVVVLLAVGGAALWWLARGDRRALVRAGRSRASLPEKLSLESLPPSEDDARLRRS